MKSVMKKTVFVGLLFVLGLVLIGCSSNDSLTNLNSTMVSVVSSTNNIDDVSSEDLSEQNVTILSMSFDNITTNLSFEPGLSNLEKVALIRALHLSIVTHQLNINDNRDQIILKLETLKTIIDGLKEQGITLSDEDKLIVDNWIQRLKEIKVSLQATIGEAYAQMRDLRGLYDIDHLEQIYDTYLQVDDVLSTRETLVIEINTIMNNAIILLQSYQE
ncbi:MAG: hypothetical protein AB7U79_03345 [Candidatus Izemoplasmatales bacterium]